MADDLNSEIIDTQEVTYVNPDDGKTHIAKTEIRKPFEIQGDVKYNTPTQSDEVLYVKDTSKSNTIINDKTVVKGDTKVENTKTTRTVKNGNAEIAADKMNAAGYNTIVAGPDNTAFVSDNTKTVYDKTGKNYITNKDNWSKTIKNKYGEEYRGAWLGAVEKGIGVGIGYASMEWVAMKGIGLLVSLVSKDIVYKVTFKYRTKKIDVVDSMFVPKPVTNIRGLTVASIEKGKLAENEGAERVKISIEKPVILDDLSPHPALDPMALAGGEEKGSLFQFYNMLMDMDDCALTVDMELYQYKLIGFNKYLSHYILENARVESYSLTDIVENNDITPSESMVISGYLKDIPIKSSKADTDELKKRGKVGANVGKNIAKLNDKKEKNSDDKSMRTTAGSNGFSF